MAVIRVNANTVTGKWTHPEKYQCSTLRFTPPKDFPKYYSEIIGRPKIMRTFITLDEVWDYRTDEYFWNFKIGINRYTDDKNHFPYEWRVVVPTDVNYYDYLTSYAENSNEVLLNIRRYERESADGVISYEKLEEVVTNVVEHYKELCPNIVYIEALNEPEEYVFGGLNSEEIYKYYKCVRSAVKKLNEKHSYARPLQIGGFAMSGGGVNYWSIWEDFLNNLAADKEPGKKIDYFSFHIYNYDGYMLELFLDKHNEAVKRLGFSDIPILVDEYGSRLDSPTTDENLKNASANLFEMIRAEKLENVKVFPWCSYHNPDQQSSFTQFIRCSDGSYASTPNAHAMQMLSMLYDEELQVKMPARGTPVVTKNGNKYAAIYPHKWDLPMDNGYLFCNLKGKQLKVTEYYVDSVSNNVFASPSCKTLEPTAVYTTDIVNGEAQIGRRFEPYSFCMWMIEEI